MAVPARPVSGQPTASDWGQVVHDSIVAQDVQSGQVNISISASTQGSVTVTFPRAFAANPSVVAMIVSTAGGALGLFIQANTVTPTTVTLRLSAPASTTIANVPVQWIAIGPRT